MAKKSFKIKAPLAAALNDTISAAKHYAGDLHVEVIPLRKLELDPENPRELHLSFSDVETAHLNQAELTPQQRDEIESLKSLASSIKEQGIINPIMVYKYGEHYRLIAGERRSLASMLAQKQDIPARVLPAKPKPLKLSLLQWAENMERADLNLWERLQNIDSIIDAYQQQENLSAKQVTGEQVMRLLSCSRQQASCYQTLRKASNILQDSLRQNQIKNIDKAVLIARAPVKHQPSLISACINGATLKQLKHMAQQLSEQVDKASAKNMANAVQFGRCHQPQVARFIIEAVLAHKSMNELKQRLGNIDWQDHQALSSAFQGIIKHLEEME